MENQRGTMMKVCNFYISQWHLAMTLIPYLKTNMEQYEVGTLFERDISTELVSRNGKTNETNTKKTR